MGWRQTFQSIIVALDDAADRAGDAFRERATPVIAGAAGKLDDFLTETGNDAVVVTHGVMVAFDTRSHEFIVKHVDPLFGKKRSSHLAEMSSLEVSPAEKELNRQIGRATLAVVAVLGGGMLFPPSLYITVPLSLTVLKPVYQMAGHTVKKHGRLTFNVVTAINVTILWLTGSFRTAIVAMLLFMLSEKLLLITQDRSHKGMISVFSKQPQTVWVLIDGVEIERPFASIVSGDIVVIEAGGFVSVDGTIVDGMASIDQQMLTGEAQPVEKAPGDVVYASTLVLAGRIFVRVDQAGAETVASKIGDALNRTASYQLDLQSRGAKLADDMAVPTLALGGVALGTVGLSGAQGILTSSLGVTVRVSAPITMLNLLNIAAQNAILLKDGRSLELLTDIDTVVFDKTGTLTMTQPHVGAIYCVEGFDERRLLTYAAAAEHRQTHPIALAVLAEANERGLELPDIGNASYEIGYGILVEFEERTIRVGSDRFMTRSGIEIPQEIQAQKLASYQHGHSMIMVAVDDALAGAIELQPTIRPEVPSVLAELRARGLKLMVVSGDQEEPTRRLAQSLGLDRYYANVLPERKAALVEQLQDEGRAVCFVGDGINDSIALKKANVSVSLSGATTVATDTAQVVLMQESLEKLPFLFTLSEDMARTLNMGRTVSMIPGAITIGGVFLLGWGFYEALGVYFLGLATSLGIAMYPLYRHRKLLEANEANESKPEVTSLATSPA